jgi:hypothetical protein
VVTPHGKEYQAQWWHAAPPEGATMEYNYRILPELEPGLEEQLRATTGGGMGPTYIFTKLGIIGLYVLAFHSVSMNKIPGPDTTSVYVYLMHPIVRIVQDYLKQWALDPKHGRGGRFEIATAGVMSDPLDKRVLSEGGLTVEEMKRIAEFYPLYVDPTDRLMEMIQTTCKVSIADAPAELKRMSNGVRTAILDLVSLGSFSGYINWQEGPEGMIYLKDAAVVQTTKCPNCGYQRNDVGEGAVTCPQCKVELFIPSS